jgi:hypothetical protein
MYVFATASLDNYHELNFDICHTGFRDKISGESTMEKRIITVVATTQLKVAVRMSSHQA